MEEIPLIKSAYEEQRVKDMDLWEQQEEERVSIFHFVVVSCCKLSYKSAVKQLLNSFARNCALTAAY